MKRTFIFRYTTALKNAASAILMLICLMQPIREVHSRSFKEGALPLPFASLLHKSNGICHSEECKQAATILIQTMNMSADPCEDFYEFACGGWVSQHPVPATASLTNQFNVVMEKVELEIRGILEEKHKPSDLQTVQAAKVLYQTCMDTGMFREEGERQELEGVKPLSDLLQELGDWPMASDNWEGKEFKWSLIAAEMKRRMIISALVSASVYLDQKNSNQSVIIIDQTSLGLPRSMLTEPSTYNVQLEAYRKWIQNSAHEIVRFRKLNVSDSRIKFDSYDVVEFEIELAYITASNADRRNGYRMYNPMTLKELQAMTDTVHIKNSYAKIQWLDFLQDLLAEANVQLTPDEKVIVNEVQFISDLLQLLDKTSPRVIANYLMWRVVKTTSTASTRKMRDLVFHFDRVYSGTKEKLPRWRECIAITSESLSFAVGYSYVEKYFDDEAKKTALQMVDNIRKQFSSSMDTVDWMDEETRRVAKDKADAMLELIGFPDWYINGTAVDDYYKGLSIGKSHFINAISSRTFIMNQFLSKLRQPTNRGEWLASPDTVNAFYNPQANTITFPAAILQPPFFSKGRPEALNYGSIGVVIAHEITHGFDDRGRQSDKFGNLAQWWSQKTIETYLQKAQCFIDKYNNYRVPELDDMLHTEVTMNGVITQGENIADNGGLRQAFRAYQKFVKYNGPDLRLPGLEEYSPEQLFFIGFGTVWCESTTKESLLHEVLADSHSPAKMRVVGPLSNSKEFAQAWKCPLGSRMNPEHKCMLW